MSCDDHYIYYLCPEIVGSDGAIRFSFPEELRNDYMVFGTFVFVRDNANRGRRRTLKFPAITGFGGRDQQADVLLQSIFKEGREGAPGGFESSRYQCMEESDRPWLKKITFRARLISSAGTDSRRIQFSGSAGFLNGKSVWALIPESREYLEVLWREHKFYFLGLGSPPTDPRG